MKRERHTPERSLLSLQLIRTGICRNCLRLEKSPPEKSKGNNYDYQSQQRKIHDAWYSIKVTRQLGMVVHTYNSSTQEAEVGGLRVRGQPGLHSEVMSQQNKQIRSYHACKETRKHDP
jgi:hypothetical protein